jgi:alcohol dehydrogenase class IV
MTADAFAFDYAPGKLVSGPGCVGDLGDELDSRGLDRAMVMCGSTVGSTAAVMEPVRAGLADHLVDVFDRTSAKKYLGTAAEAAALVEAADIDAIVAVGGGSALDTAKATAALTSHDGPPEAVAEEMIAAGNVTAAAEGDPVPVIAVPTTLAGADLSVIAGTNLTLDPGDMPDHEIPSGSVVGPGLMPTALFYDADLFAATPSGLLTASAMNGFDKALEALYSRHATPVTDGTATRAIRLFSEHAAVLNEDDPDRKRLTDAVNGIVLAQYGVSTPGTYKLSVIHAFGHGFSHDYEAHQGTVHAIVAPHVLRYLFHRVDGRRHLLAEAFGIDTDGFTDEEVAGAVIDQVVAVRDALELPAELRRIDGLDRDHLPSIAQTIADDGLMSGRPEGLEMDVDDIEDVLRTAW